MADWQSAKLGDVARVKSGFAFKSSDWQPFGVPVVKIANVKSGRLEMDGCSFVTEEVASTATDYLLAHGDVLIAMTGYIGDVARAGNDDAFLVNQRVGRFAVTDATRLDQSYLFYALRNPETRAAVAALGYGSAQPNVSPTLIHTLPFLLPPLVEQRAIAAVLGALDDKIELNRRMNRTLEELARAIFWSWFVDFDPVRAKAAGRTPVGMDAETAALFPVGFVGSEVGEVPEGWRVGTIGDVAALTKGRSYKSEHLSPSRTALVTLKSFNRGGGYREDGLKEYMGPYGAGQVVRPGDLVIALTDVTQAAEVVGRPALVGSSQYDTLVASLDVGILRPLSADVSLPFLAGLLDTSRYVGHVLGHTSGTTVLHLDHRGVSTFAFPLPPKAVMDAFTAIAIPLGQLHRENHRQAASLAVTRDYLLPKLLSGEVRVDALTPGPSPPGRGE